MLRVGQGRYKNMMRLWMLLPLESFSLSMSAKGNISPISFSTSFLIHLSRHGISRDESHRRRGHIQFRAYLSGPECKFGLNDKLELEDCWFHQYARLNGLNAVRTIKFYTSRWGFWADGVGLFMGLLFLLDRYRSISNVNVLICIISSVIIDGKTQV